MESPRAGDEPAFKDYYLILRLHPRADAALINRAYWHLAQLYRAAWKSDTSAKAKLDDLNEAYRVLGSPSLREAYDRIRDALLGEEALPTPPLPESPPPPLPVLVKQRLRPRQERRPQRSQSSGFSVRQFLAGRLPRLAARPTAGLLVAERGRAHRAIDPDTLRHSTTAMRARFRESSEPVAPPVSRVLPSNLSHEESDLTP